MLGGDACSDLIGGQAAPLLYAADAQLLGGSDFPYPVGHGYHSAAYWDCGFDE